MRPASCVPYKWFFILCSCLSKIVNATKTMRVDKKQKWMVVNIASHYIDVIMTTMASQISSLTVVYSIVYSGAGQRKHQSSALLAFVELTGTGEFPAQRASNAENVSIWWRHHMTTAVTPSWTGKYVTITALTAPDQNLSFVSKD